MTDTPLPDAAASSPDSQDGSIFGPVHVTRTIIIATGVLFAIIFYYAFRWLPWPSEPGFRGSMAQPRVALGGFVLAIFLLIACTIVGTFITGRRWFLAGLMATTAGLATWSVRGGTMTPVLFNAVNSGANQTVFLEMLLELVVFFGVIAMLWNMIWSSAGRLGDGSQSGAIISITRSFRVFGSHGSAVVENAAVTKDQEGRSTIAALAAQTAIMLILLLILVVTPLKKQVLTSVFIAGVVATAIAEASFADRRAGRWYWAAPLVIGVIGYLAGYFWPAGIEMGNLQGALAPLTRVLPLDYASMGCAGVLFGYWWMEPEAGGDTEAAVAAEPKG